MRLILATLFFIALTAHAEEMTVTAPEKSETAALTADTVAKATESKAGEGNDAATTAKKESEIPLNLESPKKSSDEGHPIFKILLAVSMMGLVGTGAFFFIRKYSKANFALNRHNQIKVLTQHYLGPKKSLAIIRVAGESILIGVTDHNISMIKSLSLLDDEVPENAPTDFSGLIQDEEQDPPVATTAFKMDAEDEEFSIRGIKDVVSKRLKGMRSFQ
jgi:flagellar protein FliO/FliZ